MFRFQDLEVNIYLTSDFTSHKKEVPFKTIILTYISCLWSHNSFRHILNFFILRRTSHGIVVVFRIRQAAFISIYVKRKEKIKKISSFSHKTKQPMVSKLPLFESPAPFGSLFGRLFVPTRLVDSGLVCRVERVFVREHLAFFFNSTNVYSLL